jgi:hypothetical protein
MGYRAGPLDGLLTLSTPQGADKLKKFTFPDAGLVNTTLTRLDFKFPRYNETGGCTGIIIITFLG